MANEKTPVVWDDDTKKHRPLGTGEKMGGLDASSILSSDSGNLIQTGSDGLAYLSGGSIADPRADNLLEESASGKLQVTADRIVEWLGLNPSDAEKIAEALAAKMAAELADGQTITASGGKLHSDPTNATVAQKRAISEALADPSSGVVVDPSTGLLGVDFSQMPTDKFETLLAGLKMQVPLAANLTLHVDNQSAAAGDDIVDGRGTAAKPFRTINGCVSWAAGYYSLGRYWITVKVHPGNYDETVALSSYDSSSGGFVIEAFDYANPPVVLRQGAGDGACVRVARGKWTLRRMKFVNNPVKIDEVSEHFFYCINVSGNGSCGIEGCEFDMSYFGDTTTHTNMFVIDATTGASVDLYPIDTYASKFAYNKGNSDHLVVLNASANSAIRFRGSNSPSAVFDFPCRGVASWFAVVSTSSMTMYDGSNTHMRFVVEPGFTCTGRTYSVSSGGYISAPQGGFPGDAESGYVEDATYSWYKE